MTRTGELVASDHQSTTADKPAEFLYPICRKTAITR
jgi:hypothetical protein